MASRWRAAPSWPTGAVVSSCRTIEGRAPVIVSPHSSWLPPVAAARCWERPDVAPRQHSLARRGRLVGPTGGKAAVISSGEGQTRPHGTTASTTVPVRAYRSKQVFFWSLIGSSYARPEQAEGLPRGGDPWIVHQGRGGDGLHPALDLAPGCPARTGTVGPAFRAPGPAGHPHPCGGGVPAPRAGRFGPAGRRRARGGRDHRHRRPAAAPGLVPDRGGHADPPRSGTVPGAAPPGRAAAHRGRPARVGARSARRRARPGRDLRLPGARRPGGSGARTGAALR